MLRSQDSSAWWKDGGGNFKVPIPKEVGAHAERPAVSDPLSRAIIDLEEASAVTLMHRFNRASDLLADIMRVSVRATPFLHRSEGHEACTIGCLDLQRYVRDADTKQYFY